ncbi:MAG: hypothetical protein FD133_814 [Erysipelotrichaceae bacterium]|nr:MAG: hypothetical protein FD179_976 [Erysipelotrichaceae bacterium]TXT18452.1 MAG: hypothetical protein FD133_814 [Erysipelotrichaceae bacterium]
MQMKTALLCAKSLVKISDFHRFSPNSLSSQLFIGLKLSED